MSDPLPCFDAAAVPSAPWVLICPQCRSIDLVALGRVFASRSGVQGLYCCRRCTTETWFRTDAPAPWAPRAARGVLTAQRELTPPEGVATTASQGVATMTTALAWHSTRTTDRTVYHTDTRCLEGRAITLTDRRPGEGRRDPCEQCEDLLFDAIEETLLPPSSTPPLE